MPALTGTLAGPMAASVEPEAVTLAEMVPAGTFSCSDDFGLVSAVMTFWSPAYTSTAGAAAVCRTMTQPCPAGGAVGSFTNGVSTGLPDASRWATRVAFAPAGSVTLPVMTGAAVAAAPAARTSIVESPAGND